MSVPAQMVWSVVSPGSKRTMLTGMLGIPLETEAIAVQAVPLLVVLKMRPTSSRMSCFAVSSGVTLETMYVLSRSVGIPGAAPPRCVGLWGKAIELVDVICCSGPLAPSEPMIDWLEVHDHGWRIPLLGSNEFSTPT